MGTRSRITIESLFNIFMHLSEMTTRRLVDICQIKDPLLASSISLSNKNKEPHCDIATLFLNNLWYFKAPSPQRYF